MISLANQNTETEPEVLPCKTHFASVPHALTMLVRSAFLDAETKPEVPAGKTHDEQAGTGPETTSERRPTAAQPQVQVCII